MVFESTEDGNLQGQFRLAHLYIKGIGTNKDEKKAFEWFLKPAEGGNSSVQYNLGLLHAGKNEKVAFEWFLKSAESGNPDGQFRTGLSYRNGIGVSPNQKKAAEWI